MDKSAKIYVAGHGGLVGSAICRALAEGGYANLITRNRGELDLTRQQEVDSFFARERPEYVFLAAAKVGGIVANQSHPAEFIRDNLLIQTHIVDAAHRESVVKLLFLGSSCIYPRLAPQPIEESSLLSGPLESTNEAYAVAKIAGIKTCQAYRRQYGMAAISLMPTNLYGPHDNFDETSSHVIPGLISKFHRAMATGEKVVEIWGSGAPRREFLHVDDLASACLHLMRDYDDEAPINVGHGSDISIADLASLIGDVVGFGGELAFDRSKPDGTPRKLLDSSKLRSLGWTPNIGLRQGLEETYRWYCSECL